VIKSIIIHAGETYTPVNSAEIDQASIYVHEGGTLDLSKCHTGLRIGSIEMRDTANLICPPEVRPVFDSITIRPTDQRKGWRRMPGEQ
jgi:hypothetical protein